MVLWCISDGGRWPKKIINRRFIVAATLLLGRGVKTQERFWRPVTKFRRLSHLMPATLGLSLASHFACSWPVWHTQFLISTSNFNVTSTLKNNARRIKRSWKVIQRASSDSHLPDFARVLAGFHSTLRPPRTSTTLRPRCSIAFPFLHSQPSPPSSTSWNDPCSIGEPSAYVFTTSIPYGIITTSDFPRSSRRWQKCHRYRHCRCLYRKNPHASNHGLVEDGCSMRAIVPQSPPIETDSSL